MLQSGTTALILAAKNGDKLMMKFLLAAGADNVNYQGHEGASALQITLNVGNVEMAEMLVYAGAAVGPLQSPGSGESLYHRFNHIAKLLEVEATRCPPLAAFLSFNDEELRATAEVAIGSIHEKFASLDFSLLEIAVKANRLGSIRTILPFVRYDEVTIYRHPLCIMYPHLNSPIYPYVHLAMSHARIHTQFLHILRCTFTLYVYCTQHLCANICILKQITRITHRYLLPILIFCFLLLLLCFP